VTFQQSVVIGLKKSFTWDFTASRAEFWWFQLFIIPSQFLSLALLGASSGLARPMDVILVFVFSLSTVFLFTSELCAVARRIHDSGHNGLWAIWFIPALIVAGFLPSKLENNKYRGDAFCPEGHELEVTAKWCMRCAAWLPGHSATN